jgi:hypothetical protein
VPLLKNPKHERFACALAKGETATRAYELAGYRSHDGNAATLRGNQKVQDRVAEILKDATATTTLTITMATERLLAIAAKGERSGEASMLSVARLAIMDACKLNGLVIDKSTVSANLGLEAWVLDSMGQPTAPQKSGSD